MHQCARSAEAALGRLVCPGSSVRIGHVALRWCDMPDEMARNVT